MSVSAWKQWLYDFIHNRPSDDDWVEILIDFTCLWPVTISIWVFLLGGFAISLFCLDRKMKKELLDH
jgi:hypothetical protein